jgi:hypothetical protein
VVLVLTDRTVLVGSQNFVRLKHYALADGFKAIYGPTECTYGPLTPPYGSEFRTQTRGWFGGMDYFFTIRENGHLFVQRPGSSGRVERVPADQPPGFPIEPEGECTTTAGKVQQGRRCSRQEAVVGSAHPAPGLTA